MPVSSAEQKEKKPRKEILGKKFEEQNITRFEGKNGKCSYRVQIRKRVDGKQHSLTKTFKHLPNAKKWQNNQLREIEANGFPIQIVTETTISDVIEDRLKRGKTLGRSALQVLTFIKADEFGKTKVSTLTQQQLYDYADLLSAGERMPQTVANYMTHLARTLSWS